MNPLRRCQSKLIMLTQQMNRIHHRSTVLLGARWLASRSRLDTLAIAKLLKVKQVDRDVSQGARRRNRGGDKLAPELTTDFALQTAEAEQPQVNEQDGVEVEQHQTVHVGQSASRCPWATLGLDERVTDRLTAIGVLEPSPIQQEAIPAILSGRNAAVQSYTGSGKTLAYLLPILMQAVERAEAEMEEARKKHPKDWPSRIGQVQAIVVAPSRELAMQIVRVAQDVLPTDAKAAVQQVIGGANPHRQVEALRFNKPLLVVGTPGRLADLSKQGHLQTHNCPVLVLDEVDQLLAPHFREEMDRLHEHCGRKVSQGRQTVVVSATITPKVLQLASHWCPEPQKGRCTIASVITWPLLCEQVEQHDAANGVQVIISAGQRLSEADQRSQPAGPSWGWGDRGWAASPGAGRGSAGGMGTSEFAVSLPPQLQHMFVETEYRHRVDAVRRAIHALECQRALVFMNFQQRLKDTQGKLAARGMEVGVLHGELDKVQRANILRKFRKGDYRALIVSDVVTRGLDIPDCDAVFNLEIPSDAAHYAHRAGRTGRMGKPGVVVSVVTQQDKRVVVRMAERLNVPLTPVTLSHGTVQPVEDDKFEAQQLDAANRSPRPTVAQ